MPSLLLLLALAFPVAAGAAPGPLIVDGLAPDANGFFDGDQCRGCSGDRQVQGLCTNECTSCKDATRTTAGAGGCAQFTGNAAACVARFELTVDGMPIACSHHHGFCAPCAADQEVQGQCENTCTPCADANRTLAGSWFPDACRAFDGNEAACDGKYVLVGFTSAPIPCFYAAGECHACDVGQRLAGECGNTCSTCEAPAHVTFLNEPADDGCLDRADEQPACESSWYFERGSVPSQCFFTPRSNENRNGFLFIQDGFDRLAPLVTNGNKIAVCLGCNGTTAVEGFEHGFDASTLPGLGWSREIITEYDAIPAFFADTISPSVLDAGIVYMPSQEDDSGHGGLVQEQLDAINDGAAALAAFVNGGGGIFAHTQLRLDHGFQWLSSILPQADARLSNTCVGEPQLTAPGAATFPSVPGMTFETLDNSSGGYFRGSFGPLVALAVNQCRDVDCKDPAHTNYVGGAHGNDACAQFGNDDAACDAAWHVDRIERPAPCSSAVDPNVCTSCGRTELGEDPCPNTCFACDDPARTTFLENGCESLGTNVAACALAWQRADGLATSCYYDVPAGFCRACDSESQGLGYCATNSCEAPAAVRAVVIGPAIDGVTTSTVATTTSTTTSTTTTTTTSTTTTSVPPGECGPRAATYESILCRLDLLIAMVRASDDLGRTKRSLEKLSVKARERTATSQGLVTGGKRKAIKNTLHKGSRKMVGFNFRVRSLVGRRVIGDATASALRALGEPLLDDMRTLLKTL